MRPLARRFYARPPEVVAPELLGRLIVREGAAGRRVGRIVEVEAYAGARDPASHAFRGRTRRNRTMFGPPGHAYIYVSYGIHHCLNVVTGADGRPSAVLIRAFEPVAGLALMARNLPCAATPRRYDSAGIARGPGRVARALGLTLRHDGIDLTGGPLWIAARAPRREGPVVRAPRVGISRGVARRWRFFVAGHPSVSWPRGIRGSKPRPEAGRPRR